MSRSKKRIKSASCPNCHTVFADEHSNYCAHCGQENHTHKLPIKHFAMELVESFTHFDTKFLTTFKDLVLSPGLVIQKFNDNKRARYVPPIRLYAFTSFAFFLVLALSFGKKVEKESVRIDSIIQKEHGGQVGLFHQTRMDSTTSVILRDAPNLTNVLIDSVLRARNIETDWFNTRILHTIIRLQKGELSVGDIYNKFIKSFSYSIFILMPVFALILMLFYRKRNYFYAEFLVFSIYYHTFIFGVLGILMLINRLFMFDSSTVFSVLAVCIFPYLGLAIKRVFGDSNVKTLVKGVLLSLVYVLCLFLLVVFLVLSSFV